MKEYNSDSIKTLDSLEHIRLRSGMYIGSIGLEGIHHLFNEVLDNAIDEYISGNGKEILVCLDTKKDFIWVQDYGRGIPPDKIIDVFTKINTSGKFNDKVYHTSAGLNGIGLKAVTALSKDLKVKVYRDRLYFYEFEKGKLTSKNTNLQNPFLDIKNGNTGTAVGFSPDSDIFETTKFDTDLIKTKLFNLASLLPGLLIKYKEDDNEVIEFKSLIPLKDIQDKQLTSESIFEFEKSYDNLTIRLNYCKDSQCLISSYINTIHNFENGSHVDSVIDTLSSNLLKITGRTFSRTQVSQGLKLTVSLFFKEPIFRGQNKSKVSDNKVKKFVYDTIYNDIFKALNSNKEFINYMVELITQQEKLIQELDIKKTLNNIKANVRENKLPEKLSVAYNCTPNERELFIVEGNSAGGSVRTARNPKFQEVLPLRGKVINAMKSDFSSVISNKEVTDIFLAIGGMEETNTTLRTKNVFILADSDDDGAHIYSLILSMFTVLFPSFIKKHNLYVVYSPLFTLISGDIRMYGHNTKSVIAEFKKLHPKKNYEIHRNKGLGEMDSSELAPVIHPNTRKIDKAILVENSVNEMNLLMGSLSEARKSILTELEVENAITS
jgi:DNA gyrase/topoisomerase IV subunit B